MQLRALILSTCLTLIVASPASLSAEADTPAVQELIDQLREITDKARDQRAADRWLLNDLEELVSRYDWPWRNLLLSEDFSDGDYARDPAWNVVSGEFWVDERLGLRSRSEPPPTETAQPQRQERREEQDLGKALLGALLNEALRDERQEQASPEPTEEKRHQPAVIQLGLDIPSVYALQLEFSIHNPPEESGQLAFGLFQDRRGDTGYQLNLLPGKQTTLELLSKINGRTRVLDRVTLDDISGGRSHTLVWRRDSEGQVEVLLNETQRLSLRDRSFRDPFTHLSILNQAGDVAISSVTLHGG